MSGISLAYRIEDHAARATLARLADFDARAAFDEIGTYLDSETTNRFKLGVAPDGTPWAPLAESTLLRRMLRGVSKATGKTRRRLTTKEGNTRVGAVRALAGARPLVDRGHLRDSFTHRVFADGSGLEHGSNLVYAAIHHFGAGRRSSLKARRVMPAIPARPIVGLNDANRADIEEIVTRHLEEAIR